MSDDTRTTPQGSADDSDDRPNPADGAELTDDALESVAGGWGSSAGGCKCPSALDCTCGGSTW